MRGLLMRLSRLDPDAEAELRLISYFDELVSNRASLEAVVRATAAIAECTAGARDDQTGQVVRYDGHGRRSQAPAAEHLVAERDVLTNGLRVGHVWLERDVVHGSDEMVIERMAITAAARWSMRAAPHIAATDPALMEAVLSDGAEAGERTRALRLLGLQPSQIVRVVALAGLRDDEGGARSAAIAAALEHGRSRSTTRAARIGDLLAIIDPSGRPFADVARLMDGAAVMDGSLQAGIGTAVPAGEAAESWHAARIALRFVATWPRAAGPVAYEELGAVAALADVSPRSARRNRDVRALERLAGKAIGRLDVETLLGFVRDGSLRLTAAQQHLHHSTIANRLQHVESALDLSLSDPIGRQRAQVAAIVWKLNEREGPAQVDDGATS